MRSRIARICPQSSTPRPGRKAAPRDQRHPARSANPPPRVNSEHSPWPIRSPSPSQISRAPGPLAADRRADARSPRRRAPSFTTGEPPCQTTAPARGRPSRPRSARTWPKIGASTQFGTPNSSVHTSTPRSTSIDTGYSRSTPAKARAGTLQRIKPRVPKARRIANQVRRWTVAVSQ